MAEEKTLTENRCKNRSGPWPAVEGRAGSILILTLWTLFFLAALAVAVGSYVQANIGLAVETGRGSRAYFCAVAGVEHARKAVFGDTNGWDGVSEVWYDSPDLFKDIKCGDGYFSLFRRTWVDGVAVTNYGLIGEESRININHADQPLLEAMWLLIGGADSMTATELAESVIDWRDPDDDLLTHGAENGYYSALNPPYECHNGNFARLHELLLVKGVTGELFSRVRAHLTVYGEGKVNLNTASVPVLSCVALASGADEDVSISMARKIVAFTNSGRQFEEPDAASIRGILREAGGLTDKEDDALSRSFGRLTINSDYLRGNSRGKVSVGAQFSRAIEFVVRKTDGSIVFWSE